MVPVRGARENQERGYFQSGRYGMYGQEECIMLMAARASWYPDALQVCSLDGLIPCEGVHVALQVHFDEVLYACFLLLHLRARRFAETYRLCTDVSGQHHEHMANV